MKLWEDKRINVNTNQHDDELINEVITEARAQLFNPDSGEYVSEDAELIDWMYEGYVELYGLEPEWTPVAVEYPDRKSTRLNSSHVAISYAVFCLKKKNIK